MRSLLELVVTVAVAILVAFLIQAFLIKPYRIPSGSMIPTLDIGQRILVNRLDTHPHLGAVVVFHPPIGATESSPAVCGDSAQGTARASMCDDPTARESAQTFVKRLVGLPGDRLSLRHGVLYRNGAPERVAAALPCGGGPDCDFPHTITVPRGDYFMMGDNRSISDDSRYWGPVPQRWVIGVAVATYWPIDRIGVF